MPNSSEPSASAGMLAELRHATSTLHQRLDSALSLEPTTVTREQYALFLRALFSVVPELEQRIARVPGFVASVPQAERRQRSQLLVRDLQALGVAATPLCTTPALPPIETLGQALGASYVLEGSSLGGAVLARSLGPALALESGAGLSYWTAYGGDLRELWLTFGQALEGWAQSASSDERAAAVDTAVGVFESFLHVSDALKSETKH